MARHFTVQIWTAVEVLTLWRATVAMWVQL